VKGSGSERITRTGRTSPNWPRPGALVSAASGLVSAASGLVSAASGLVSAP
jgi:hypothetical protein